MDSCPLELCQSLLCHPLKFDWHPAWTGTPDKSIHKRHHENGETKNESFVKLTIRGLTLLQYNRARHSSIPSLIVWNGAIDPPFPRPTSATCQPACPKSKTFDLPILFSVAFGITEKTSTPRQQPWDYMTSTLTLPAIPVVFYQDLANKQKTYKPCVSLIAPLDEQDPRRSVPRL